MDIEASEHLALLAGWQFEEASAHILDASRCIWIAYVQIDGQRIPLLVRGSVQVPLSDESLNELVKWAHSERAER